MLKVFFMVLTMTATLFAETETLIQAALNARSHSYSPYSHYAVGAALLTTEGEIIQGCNVENASYGLTQCAERSALVAAVSQGKKEFVAIVVATRDGGLPCGACRQVLNEFTPDIRVIAVNGEGTVVHETTLRTLFPDAFGPHNLEN